ncbi:DISARM anti-phage system protein DrmE domain-containing protein [Nocardia gipuzkoensis]
MSSAEDRQGGGNGLAAAVVDGTLRRRDVGLARARRFEPTELDIELLSIVDAAADRGIPLGLVLPLAGTAAPMLVGAASLVGAIRRSGRLDVQVGLVARNLAPRALYDRLYIKEQRLADFVPRTTVGVDGDVRIVGEAARDSQGRLHITSGLDRLGAAEATLAAIVIDASASSPEALERTLRRCKTNSVVYMTTNPFDPSLRMIRTRGGLVYGWSAERVSALSGGCTPTSGSPAAGALIVDRSFLSASSACDIDIEIASTTGDLDSATEHVWTLLRKLGRAIPRAARLDGRPAEELWWGWGVLNTISMLPAAPDRYDQFVDAYPSAIRLMEAPAIASGFARNAHGELARLWHELANGLERLLTAAGHGDRTARVAAWVAELVADNVYGTLIAKNRAAASATRQALDESPETPHGWAEHVRILTFSELAKGEALSLPPSSICLPGPIPRTRAGVFALPPATEMHVIAAGECEGRRVAAQVAAARAEMTRLSNAGTDVSETRLGLNLVASSQARVGDVRLRRPDGLHDVGRRWDAQIDPWEPFDPDIAATLRRQVDSGSLPREESIESSIRGGGARTTAAITIELDNGPEGRRFLLVEPNDLVARRHDERFERVAAKALKVGDIVLLVDSGAKGDLLATLIERLAETPYYDGLQQIIDFWHTHAALGRQAVSGLTQQEILNRMTGTSLTAAQTIGNWIRGAVDGPRDPADVARFARALGNNELLAHADRIVWALATIHATHKRVSVWVNRRLAGIESDREQLILNDENARIYVTDLMDAISVHRVRSVDDSLVHVRTSLVGTLVAVSP